MSAMPEPAAPVNLDAEAAVVGAVLANPKLIDVVRPIVEIEHFAHEHYAAIWAAMLAVADTGTAPSVIALRNWADRQERLAELGGWPTLARLAAATIPGADVRNYAGIVRDCWRRRRMVEIIAPSIKRLREPEPGESAADIAGALESGVADLVGDSADSPIVSLGTAMGAAMRDADLAGKGMRQSVATGFHDLDRMIGGFEPGHVYVIGGRPSMGKTSLGLWAAVNAARAGHRTLFISLEMVHMALGRRVIAGMGRYDLARIKSGVLEPEDWWRMREIEKGAAKLPLFIDERAGQSIASITARCRVMHRRGPLRLLVVDHLGMVQAPREMARLGATAAVEHASAGIQRLAKDLGVAVILLCQLNRGVEGRDDKRPTLADLRQSGAIEQDADVVMFVYREAYYAQRRKPQREAGENIGEFQARCERWTDEVAAIASQAEILVAKNRDGPIGHVAMHYDERCARFSSAG